jgi:hypothetical protein
MQLTKNNSIDENKKCSFTVIGIYKRLNTHIHAIRLDGYGSDYITVHYRGTSLGMETILNR